MSSRASLSRHGVCAKKMVMAVKWCVSRRRAAHVIQTWSFALVVLFGTTVPCAMAEHQGMRTSSAGIVGDGSGQAHHRDCHGTPERSHDHSRPGRLLCCHSNILGEGVGTSAVQTSLAPDVTRPVAVTMVFNTRLDAAAVRAHRFVFRVHPPRFPSAPVFLSNASLLI